MIISLSDVGCGQGVVAVIATGPRLKYAYQRIPRALMQADRFRRWSGAWVIIPHKNPLLLNTIPSTCRSTEFSPAIPVVLYAAKRPIKCRKKNIYLESLTDIAIRRQKSDVNAVRLVKTLDHVDLGNRVSGLFEKSFGGVENDNYGYDDLEDDDYGKILRSKCLRTTLESF